MLTSILIALVLQLLLAEKHELAADTYSEALINACTTGEIYDSHPALVNPEQLCEIIEGETPIE